MLAALRKAIVDPDRRETQGPTPAAAMWLAKPGRRPGESLVPESFSPSDILDVYALIGSTESRLEPHLRPQLRLLLAQRGLWNRGRSKSDQEAIAAAGLQRIGDSEGLEGWLNAVRDLIVDADAILTVIEHEDPRVRRAAYSALIRAGQRGHRPAMDAAVPQKLLEDLASKDAELRAYARGAAGLLSAPRLAPAFRAYIARSLEQKGTAWEDDVSWALGRLARLEGARALPDLRAWLEDHPRSSAHRYLPDLMGEDVVTVFLELVGRGASPGVLLSALNKRELQVAFLQLLPPESCNPKVIDSAGRVLPDEALEEWLRKLLRSGAQHVGKAVAEVAGRKHLAGLWPELLPLLEDPDDHVRETVKQALEEIRWYHDVKATLETFGPTGRAEALAEAKKLAGSEDPVQRRGAAFALAALGDPAAVPALLALLKDSEPSVREAAVEALQRLGAR
jgi:HEAT repeat protein